jgi:FMN phosphatase YigB (HAD superfamily)
MDPRLHQVQWLFLDPSVLLNENESDREARRLIAAGLAKRGRPASQEQVERAWMQAISATRPIHPLAGAVQILTADAASAQGLIDEVTRNLRSLENLYPGVQLSLNTLQSHLKVGVIGPYRLPGTRPKLDRFHLHFPLVALSDEVKLSHKLDPSGRVDPALFTWALKKVGCPAPKAAFASDRVDLGLAPAKAAGLTTIWLRQTNYKLRYPRTAPETPDLTFNAIGELAKALG